MKNFLYKLIFPEANKLYFGRAKTTNRYTGRINDAFCDDHHNKEVQDLLDAGEFCFWHVVKEFETFEELVEAETTWLKKVWKSDRIKDRPDWLLNRQRDAPDTRFPTGDANPQKTKEARERVSRQHKGIPKLKNRGPRPLAIRQRKINFDLEKVWKEVEKALKTPHRRTGAELKLLEKTMCRDAQSRKSRAKSGKV